MLALRFCVHRPAPPSGVLSLALTEAVLAGDDVKAQKVASAFAEIYQI